MVYFVVVVNRGFVEMREFVYIAFCPLSLPFIPTVHTFCTQFQMTSRLTPIRMRGERETPQQQQRHQDDALAIAAGGNSETTDPGSRPIRQPVREW